MPTDTTIFSFLARVDWENDTGCWNWTGGLSEGGYGMFCLGKRQALVRAHRYAYEQFKGPIPAGLVVDHLCRNRRCVNPDHLEPVTMLENIQRGRGFATSRYSPNTLVTHCPQGHPYDEENTYRTKKGHRACRQCHREKVKLYQRARYVPRPRASRAGALCPTAKLTEAQVREIHLLRMAGNVTHSQLAARFQVNQSTISRILSRKRWSHL